MHGRPRKVPSEEKQKELTVRAQKLRALQSQFLQFHHNKTYTKEAVDVSAKLLELNPEYYTAWNYRKLAVGHYLRGEPDGKTDEQYIKSILDEELIVVENALRTNYKSYGAWHHRKWVLNKGHSSTDRELMLLNRFQKEDPRNFHTWNYRRFVTSLKNIPAQEELKYTTDMIYANFSNYSAWHNRSVLLSHLLKEKVEGFCPKENVLIEEYEFVRSALFTEPDDQSGWFYHLWLLSQTVKLEHLSVSSWPPNGSKFYLSVDGLLDCCGLTQSFFCNSETFPLILYFSEAVEGVTSSTITVECDYDMNSDLIWRPIEANKSGQAHVWLTSINSPTGERHPPKEYQVKTTVGHSPGIISSSGVCCSHPSLIVFTLCVPPSNSKHGKGHHVEMIDWVEENFSLSGTHNSSLGNSFYQLKIIEDPMIYEKNIDIIAGEIAYCRTLSEMDSKIGKLTLARLLMAHDALTSCNGVNDQKTSHYKEVLELYHDLMILDPMHWQYYKDQHSLVFLRQEISNEDSLLKYCHQYRDVSSPTTNNHACVRLNNLSISRIGCFERLMWVQMLDLSYNELRSIEGLEALQLLCCLNLSNNKLCSFSALEPLKQLKSLKVLNISCNEIGAHSIDTRRYLFTSPVSHMVGNIWNSEEFAISDLEMTNYWEAFSVFRGLNLTQLDIKRNPIADENLKLIFCKILPKLKWLDGEKLQ